MPIVGSFAGASARAYGASAGVQIGDFESIATQTVGSGGASSVTFDSIPQTYTHLQIRFLARTNRADLNDVIAMRYNNDTSNSNYTYHELGGLGATTYFYGNGAPEVSSLSMGAAASSSANVFGVGIADILDYTNTNKYTTLRNIGGFDNNGSGRAAIVSGLWLNTAAITKIVLSPFVGTTLNQYSTFALYGVKA